MFLHIGYVIEFFFGSFSKIDINGKDLNLL